MWKPPNAGLSRVYSRPIHNPPATASSINTAEINGGGIRHTQFNTRNAPTQTRFTQPTLRSTPSGTAELPSSKRLINPSAACVMLIVNASDV